MTASQMYSVLDDVLTSPIAFHRIFATIGGGATEGLFLSQAFYWSKTKTAKNRDGWFYKTQAEWTRETALTRTEQESARKKLGKLGIISEKLAGLPRKLFYKVNRERLFELILGGKSPDPDRGNAVLCDRGDEETSAEECDMSQPSLQDPASQHVSFCKQSYTHRLHSKTTQILESVGSQKDLEPEVVLGIHALPVNQTEILTKQEDPSSDQKQPIPPFDKPEQSNEQEIKPLPKYVSSSEKCDRLFEPLYPWRNSKKRNDFKPEFVTWIKDKHLSKTSHYAGTEVTKGDAKAWISSKERTEDGLSQIEARFEDFQEKNQLSDRTTAQISAFASWGEDRHEMNLNKYFSAVGYAKEGIYARIDNFKAQEGAWLEWVKANHPDWLTRSVAA